MSATVVPIVTLLAMLAAGPPGAGEKGAHDASPRARSSDPAIRVRHDEKKFTTKVHVRATDGRVAWADVLRGLARARGFDGEALAGVLPEGSFNISGVGWGIARAGLNMSLSPGVRFDVQRPRAAGDDPWLVITLDQAALLESQRRFKRRIRDALLLSRKKAGGLQYGLALDEGWQKARGGRDVVVSVHGLNSGPYSMDKLMAGPRKAGFPCGTFVYPNDQAIADSARLLSAELKEFARTQPDRGIVLLTHSMGGLVARAIVEDPKLDPGNVRRLIMIAPTNGGSMLAHFAYGLDVAEYVGQRMRKQDASLFYARIEDGLAEARNDLKPDSPFLRKLNAGKRNPNVRYTIFLGSSAPLTEGELARLRQSIADPKGRWLRFFGEKVRPWLADMDEVVDGRGDGAVAVKRGRLEGVRDTHVLKFSHVGVLYRPGNDDALNKLHQMILARLKEKSR